MERLIKNETKKGDSSDETKGDKNFRLTDWVKFP